MRLRDTSNLAYPPSTEPRNANSIMNGLRRGVKYLLTTAMMVGCEFKQEVFKPTQAIEISQSQSQVAGPIALNDEGELILDATVSLPKFTYSENVISFPQPKRITCSDEEFKKAAENVSRKILGEIPKYKAALEDNPSSKEVVLMYIIDDICGYAMGEPAFKDYMEFAEEVFSSHNEENTGFASDNLALNLALKHIFLKAGLYFGSRSTLNSEIGIYPIQKKSSIQFEGGELVSQLFLGEPLFETSEITGASGKFESDVKGIFSESSATIIFPDHDFSFLNQVHMENVQDLRGHIQVHEATHAWINHVYPDARKEFKVNLTIPINGEEFGTIQGDFKANQLSELCAGGNSIAQNKDDSPLALFFDYARERHNPLDPYYLATNSLYLFTLQYLPEGVEKDVLIEGYLDQSLEPSEFTTLVLPKLTPELRFQIGSAMYQLGIALYNSSEE